MNSPDLLGLLKEHRIEAHRRLFAVIDELDHEQFGWQARVSMPSIGFHVWHLGRWADFDRQAIGGGPQIWTSEVLPAKWGLNSAALGVAETGMGMDDRSVPALADVPKERILEYAHRAVEALDAYVAALGPADLQRVTTGATGDARDIALVLLGHFSHDNRHLGMIEALRGMQGLNGTATD